MSEAQKIGVMDWGIGGFSVYAALRKAGSSADVVYLSDAGNTSYGKLGADEMRARFVDVGRFFRAHGVREVLVGCNAASSALTGDAEEFEGVVFHSIIPAGVQAAQASRKKRIGVIGGDRTIESGVYQRQLSGPRYAFRSAQSLSGFVERGDFSSDECCDVIYAAVEQLDEPGALLLACTHYPALADSFEFACPGVDLLDPAPFLIVSNRPPRGQSSLEFYTTGPAEAAAIARRAFGIDVPEPILIEPTLAIPASDRPA